MNDDATIRVDFEGDALAAIRQMQEDFRKLTGKVTIFEGEVKESFNTLNNTVSKFRTGLKQISFAAIADNVRNVADAFRQTSQPGIDFNQNMADLSAITGITGQDLSVLGDAARKMGKESGIGASQAVEAFKLLASNIDVSTIGGVEGLKSLQKETIVLSQAAGVDLPTAADAMAFALNQFNLPASEAARVVNTLGAGAKYGAAEIPDLAASLKDAGSVANQAGVSIESTVGAIEVLSQRGIKGAQAGTMLRNVLLKLQTENIPGVNLKADGLSKSLGKMTNIVNDATKMEKIFGRENITAAQILIAESAAVEQMTTRVTGTNVAYEQASIRTKTYATELAKVKAQMDDFKIGLVNATGALLPWSEYLVQILVPMSQMIPLFSALRSGYVALTTAQWALNAAQYAMPILAVVAGLTLLGAALYDMKYKYNGVRAAIEKFNDAELASKKAIVEEKFETQKLLKVARDTKLSTDERTKALDKLKEKSKEYFGQLTLDTVATEAGTKAFDDYAASILRAARAQALKDYAVEAEKSALDAEMGKRDKGTWEWIGEKSRMILGAAGGLGGMARVAGNIASQDIAQNTQFASEKRKESSLLLKKAYDVENPVEPKPLIPSPNSAGSIDKARGAVNQKSFSVGAVNATININTTTLDKSTGKIKEAVTSVLSEGIKDAQLAY